MSRDGSLKLSFESTYGNVSLLGMVVKKLSSAAGLSESESAKVALCAVEAANNAVKHAYGEEPGHEVEVTVSLESDRLVLRVSDEGETMTPRPEPVSRFKVEDLDSLPENGMGLVLIHEIMDEVAYASREGRNTLTLVKRLERQDDRTGESETERGGSSV